MADGLCDCVVILQGIDFSERIQTEGDLSSWKTKTKNKTIKGKGISGV